MFPQNSNTSITWPVEEGNTEYEWYVTVSNGENTVTGPVWSFRTAPRAEWTGTVSADWNDPANWVGGSYPGASNNVTIPDVTNDPVIGPAMTADCYDLEIQPGATLTIQSNTGNSGSLIVHGNASGNVTYDRQLPAANWHYISSPVSSLTLPSGGIFRPWNELTGQWGAATTACTSGVGYAIQTSGNSLAFEGTLVTSDVVIEASSPFADEIDGTELTYDARIHVTGRDPDQGGVYGGGGWNLLGNPYTSAMVVSEFISVNSGATAEEGQFDPNYVAIYLYNGSSYNYIGYSTGWEVDNPTLITQTHIQPGQGFFVLAMNDNSTFTFNRDMQDHSPTATFLKSAKAEDRWPGLQLKVKYGEKESLTTIVFNEDMTIGLDPGYDVGLMSSGADVDIYTALVKDNGINFARQALPILDCERNIIPVGIDTEKGGEVTFSAYTVPPGNNKFWLEDRATGIFTELDGSTYTVTLPAKTYGTGRFFIIASTNTPTAIKPVPEDPEAGIRIWTYNEEVIIKGEISSKAICTIFDINGKKILETRLADGEMNTVTLPSGKHGIYVVRVVDGMKVTTKKVALL